MKKEIVMDARAITLRIIYQIPGFEEASLETKNYVYDIVKEKVESLKD